MEPKVSVIVPVYNAEKHLKQCLDSICDQTLKEIEIICVDDGSTDSSAEMLEDYKKQDSRIQIYHQKNQFAGIARNTGMSHAYGEYLVFWDSDDYFFPTALEKMYLKAVEDNADVCVCDGEQFFEDKGYQTSGGKFLIKNYLPDSCPFNRLTHPRYILNFINAVPWNKMFRRSYIEKLDLKFQGVKTGNDVYFVECALAQAERITLVNESLVCYRRNQSTGLVSSLPSSPMAPFQAWIAVYDTLSENNALPRQSYINKILGSMVYILRNMSFDWNAFRSTVVYLKEELFPHIDFTNQYERDYYYVSWHYDFVQHLLSDSPEEFTAYLFHFTYINGTVIYAKEIEGREKNAALRKELQIVRSDMKSLREETEQVKQSRDRLDERIQEMTARQDELQEQNIELEEKNTALNRKIEQIYNSWSYRIGHALLWLPSKIKRSSSK